LKPGESVQLRLEAIDALETHYTLGARDISHQPLAAARAARRFLLDALGFEGVVWNADQTTVVGVGNAPTGYILSRTFEQNRRPVAFLYAGDPDEEDGASVFLNAARVKESVNFASVRAGFAYPTYYEGMFRSLRQPFDEAVGEARADAAPRSVWKIDRTQKGLRLPPRTNLSRKHGILPKLFRRLSQYLRSNETLHDFIPFLQASPDPCIFLPEADPTSLHNFVRVERGAVRLTVLPEHILFAEKHPQR
jgi:hypothetical protein